MTYEIKHQDRQSPGLPQGWAFVGDLMLGNQCRACLFVDEQGRLRVRPEGASWGDEHHIIFLPVIG